MRQFFSVQTLTYKNLKNLDLTIIIIKTVTWNLQIIKKKTKLKKLPSKDYTYREPGKKCYQKLI